MSDAAARPRFYKPELDRLRFLAFFAVYCCHQLPTDPPGFARFVGKLGIAPEWATPAMREVLGAIARSCTAGVTVFFVLSSYLITTLLLKEEREQGRIRLLDFYVRRALRIWPLYFAYLAAGLASRAFTPTDVAWFAAFAGNWHIVLHSPATITPPIGILWSVCIEEQFYLVWPTLLRTLARRSFVPAAIGLLTLASATRAVILWRLHGRPSEDVLWFNSIAQLDPFVAGSLVAFAFREATPEWSRARRALLLVGGCLLIGWGGAFGGTVSDNPSGVATFFAYPAFTGGSTAILLAFITGGDAPAQEVGPWVWLGRISYGLYVFHEATVRAARWIVFDRLALTTRGLLLWAILFVLGLVLTIAVAAASYVLLEKPFLRLKLRYTHVASRPGG